MTRRNRGIAPQSTMSTPATSTGITRSLVAPGVRPRVESKPVRGAVTPIGDIMQRLMAGVAGVAQSGAQLAHQRERSIYATEMDKAVEYAAEGVRNPAFRHKDVESAFARQQAQLDASQVDFGSIYFAPDKTPGETFADLAMKIGSGQPPAYRAEFIRQLMGPYATWNKNNTRKAQAELLNKSADGTSRLMATEYDEKVIDQSIADTMKLAGKNKVDRQLLLRNISTPAIQAAAIRGDMEQVERLAQKKYGVAPDDVERARGEAKRRSQAIVADAEYKTSMSRVKRGAPLSGEIERLDRRLDNEGLTPSHHSTIVAGVTREARDIALTDIYAAIEAGDIEAANRRLESARREGTFTPTQEHSLHNEIRLIAAGRAKFDGHRGGVEKIMAGGVGRLTDKDNDAIVATLKLNNTVRTRPTNKAGTSSAITEYIPGQAEKMFSMQPGHTAKVIIKDIANYSASGNQAEVTTAGVLYLFREKTDPSTTAIIDKELSPIARARIRFLQGEVKAGRINLSDEATAAEQIKAVMPTLMSLEVQSVKQTDIPALICGKNPLVEPRSEAEAYAKVIEELPGTLEYAFQKIDRPVIWDAKRKIDPMPINMFRQLTATYSDNYQAEITRGVPQKQAAENAKELMWKELASNSRHMIWNDRTVWVQGVGCPLLSADVAGKIRTAVGNMGGKQLTTSKILDDIYYPAYSAEHGGIILRSRAAYPDILEFPRDGKDIPFVYSGDRWPRKGPITHDIATEQEVRDALKEVGRDRIAITEHLKLQGRIIATEDSE